MAKKKLTDAQKAGLKKGQKILAKAREIQKAAGKKTVTTQRYKMTMADAMKKAAGK